MIALIQAWLGRHALTLAGWAAMAGAVMAVLLGARQAGRTAERVDQLKQIAEIKDAQIKAAAAAPRTRDDLMQRLRDGRF
ncbi:MAG: hypothetical protein IPI58_00070 [Alphaproteobacteria bacterium]|nr:MAG: hypothetical protein IPI58_00070 [Alphaproteobacteria bacterium]